MFHVSEVSPDIINGVLQPKVPENFWVQKGLEDGITPRICFGETIEHCLTALAKPLLGKILHIYTPKIGAKQDICYYRPSDFEVPDAAVINEYWVQETVKVDCVGEIEIIGSRVAGELNLGLDKLELLEMGLNFPIETIEWNYRYRY